MNWADFLTAIGAIAVASLSILLLEKTQMCTFAVDFMLNGKRVDRDYVTARNEKHALIIAERTTTVTLYDEVIATPL